MAIASFRPNSLANPSSALWAPRGEMAVSPDFAPSNACCFGMTAPYRGQLPVAAVRCRSETAVPAVFRPQRPAE